MAAPTAEFSATPLTGIPPLTVAFTDESTDALTLTGTHTDSLGDLSDGDTRYGYADAAAAGCGGACTLDAVEANRELVAPFDMTFTRLAVALSGGVVSFDYEVSVRVNGVTTALWAALGDFSAPGNSGAIVDGSVAVTAGDTFAIMIQKVAASAADMVATWTITYTAP